MQFKVPFDDHLKEQLGDYRPVVPDHIWENIKQKKDKKRPFFFMLRNPIFIILSIVTAGSLLGYYFIDFSNNKIAFSTAIPSSNKNKLISNSSVFNGSTTQQSINTENKIIIEEKESNAISIHENISNEKTISNQVVNQIEQSFNTDNSQKQEQIEKNNFNKNRKKSFKQITSVSISQPSIDEAINLNETFADAQFSNDLELFSSPQTVDRISLQQSTIPELRTPLKINLNIPCPDNNKNPAFNKRYVELYAAADYVLRQFTDTPNSSYMKMRKESTSFSSAYSAGIRFTKVFNNGFNIRAGLNFSQINEKLKYVQGNIIQVVFIINASGDTIGSYQTSNTRYKTSYNHYKTLDIPVTIGYETSKGRWRVNFNTGLIVNIHSWNQGEVLNDALQPVDISGLSPNPYQFKTNIGVGGIGAISCYYSINEKLSIMAEPYMRYNFSSMNKTEISLKQKYHTSGIKFGLRLNL
jgi:hypothetical protein